MQIVRLFCENFRRVDKPKKLCYTLPKCEKTIFHFLTEVIGWKTIPFWS